MFKQTGQVGKILTSNENSRERSKFVGIYPEIWSNQIVMAVAQADFCGGFVEDGSCHYEWYS